MYIMAAQKFTFKVNRATGKWKSFYSESETVTIILNKVDVGSIKLHAPYTIRLKVIKDDIAEDGNTNCIWKWITLSVKPDSVDWAKGWLNGNIDDITKKWNLVKE